MKLSLNPNPTFQLKVNVHRAGEAVTPVMFTARYRSRTEFAKWLDEREQKSKALPDPTPIEAVIESDAVLITEIATAWDLDVPLTPEAARTFVDQYHGAAAEVFTRYAKEMQGAKLGN